MASVPPIPPEFHDSTIPGSEERLWGMLCHITALAGFVVPFGNVVGPLVVWLIKKDQMPFVDDQGKESLNFQISVTIYLAISAILVLAIIGILLLIVVAVFDLVMIVIASVKSNQGERYRYPLCLRLIK